MKNILRESDANALIGNVAFISIDKANRLIRERLKNSSSQKSKGRKK